MFLLQLVPLLIFLVLVLVVSAINVEDLQSLFGNKNCIEASLVSLSLDQDAYSSVMLDSKNKLVDASLFQNNVETITVPFDKTVTSKINELAQYNEIEYSYTLISEEGPAHAKLYKVSLALGDENYQGSGSSLKKAQQAAASLALSNTYYGHPPQKLKLDEEKSLTPTVALNNIAMRVGLGVSYHLLNGKEEKTIDSYGASDAAYGKSKNYFSKLNSSSTLRIPTEDSQISGPFVVRVKVGSFAFEGFGHTIQAARHDAAFNAIKDLEKQALFKDNVCSNEETVNECKNKKEALKSPITRVYEAAQRSNLAVEFNIVGETGKDHKKTFITQCKVGDYETEAEGRSKKESKRLAAEKMLKYLPKIQDFNENAIISGLKTNKKKRKKKKKMIKSNSYGLFDGVAGVLSIWSNNEDLTKNNEDNSPQKRKDSGSVSPKDKLLEIGNKLGIQVEYTDLSKQGDVFYSVMSLGLKPPHICLGKAVTREKSHESAALYGIKFLHKFGLLDKTEFVHSHQSFSDFEEDFLREEKEEIQETYLPTVDKS